VKINEENWEEKLDYYLENPEKAKQIAENGREHIVKYHNHQVRAKTFIRILEEFR